MNNEYRMVPGQRKVLDTYGKVAGHGQVGKYDVTLEAECLSDGSVVHNVRAALRFHIRDLKTYAWYCPTEAMASKTFVALVEALRADGDIAKALMSGPASEPDEVEVYDGLDTIERAVLEEREAAKGKVVAAQLKGRAEGRFEGLQDALKDLGYEVKIEDDPMSPGNFVWTLYERRLNTLVYVAQEGSWVDKWGAQDFACINAMVVVARRLERDRKTLEDLLEARRKAARKAYDEREVEKRAYEAALEHADAETKAAREDAGRLRRTTVRVTKQASGRESVVLQDRGVYIAYVGKDPHGGDVCILPFGTRTLALRVVAGDVWTEEV